MLAFTKKNTELTTLSFSINECFMNQTRAHDGLEWFCYRLMKAKSVSQSDTSLRKTLTAVYYIPYNTIIILAISLRSFLLEHRLLYRIVFLSRVSDIELVSFINIFFVFSRNLFNYKIRELLCERNSFFFLPYTKVIQK